ncbi:MAG: trigger factor, partial [Bacteroidetes bacterium]
MNITQENTSELTATIKVEMTPEDYQAKVNEALKDLQRKANLPGFRPGKVPFGIVKKKYGDGVLAEEVNKVLGEGLNNFIKDNELEILGHPLGNREKGKPVDFDNDEEFEFYFDLGLTPKIDIELSDKIEMDYYDISVEDDKVEMYLEDIRKRFGNNVDVEEVADEDMLKGVLTQLDNKGEILENGWVFNDASLLVSYIKDEKVKKELIGKKKGGKVNFNPLKATGNETETAAMLGIKKEEKEKLEASYELTISAISRVEPSEVNEELFKKVYPKDEIKDEAQFREKLREESKKYYQRESENYFVHNTIEEL